MPNKSVGWSGHRSLNLISSPLFPASSPLSPVTGVVYVAKKDTLILALFDGTFHVIHNISVEPSWSPHGFSTTDDLSAVARAVATRAESGISQLTDMHRISGFASYDGSGIVTWVY